jgi:hypothetical protein
MKKLNVLGVLIASICGTSWASPAYQVSPLDASIANHDEFIAPIVNSESDVPRHVGLIFYDIGIGLKIVNPSGNFELISSTGVNPVGSTDSGILVESARIQCYLKFDR